MFYIKINLKFFTFICFFVLIRGQNLSHDNSVSELDDDSKVVFEIYPCNGTNRIVEVFNKSHPEYYELKIVPENFPSLPKTVRFVLKFDNLTKFDQKYDPAIYSTNSYFLNVVFINNKNENISIHVSSLQGKGHPFPNLISADINNETYCDEGHQMGLWDRFIQIEPLYSGVMTNPEVNTTGNTKQTDISSELKFGNIQCGQIIKKHEELILHGNQVGPGTWPWHAAIYRIQNIGREFKFICGGTLISKSRILTAGHCVVERGDIVIPERFSVILGKINYIGGDFGSQEKGVFQVILHPDYSPNIFSNDIAVLKLSTEAKFTEYVQPICLPWQFTKERSLLSGKYGFIVGWGATQTSRFSYNLKQAYLPVRSILECVKNNPSFFGKFLNKKSFCGGFTNGTTACNGDSGGGFYVQEGKSWFLKGIISLGVSKIEESKCDPDYYTIFTDVTEYLDFIKAVGGLQ